MLALISQCPKERLLLSPKDILLGILGTEELWADAPAAQSHTAKNVRIADASEIHNWKYKYPEDRYVVVQYLISHSK